MEFDGKTYWTIAEELPQWKLVDDDTLADETKEIVLPSDSYLRADHYHLRTKEYDISEREKYDLEEQQRKDKKARGEAEARHKVSSKK